MKFLPVAFMFLLCAWVLWEETIVPGFPTGPQIQSAWSTHAECERERLVVFALLGLHPPPTPNIGTSYGGDRLLWLRCLPDTVDPRRPTR
jgi:hypothetical protein